MLKMCNWFAHQADHDNNDWAKLHKKLTKIVRFPMNSLKNTCLPRHMTCTVNIYSTVECDTYNVQLIYLTLGEAPESQNVMKISPNEMF